MQDCSDSNWPRLQCVSCGAALSPSSAPICCVKCGSVWPVDEGIPLFLKETGYSGMSDESFDVLVRAEESGHFLFWGRKGMLNRILGGFLRSEKSLRVLDVGCGSGYVLSGLEKSGAKVVGVDASRTALKICRNRGIANIYGAFAEQLPFDNEQFDVVISMDVYEHIEDDVAAMREAGRIMPVGGKLIVFVPAVRALWSACDELVAHKRRYSKAELEDKLVDAGFVVERVTYLFPSFFLPALIVRVVSRLLLSKDSAQKSVLRDYETPSSWLNSLLKCIIWIEIRMMSLFNFPFGVSLAALAVKRKQSSEN